MTLTEIHAASLDDKMTYEEICTELIMELSKKCTIEEDYLVQSILQNLEDFEDTEEEEDDSKTIFFIGICLGFVINVIVEKLVHYFWG